MIRSKTPKPFVVTDINGIPVITDPEIGSVVEHTGWAPVKNLGGYPADVFIIKGSYNTWTWMKVRKDKAGKITLGNAVTGQGAFRKSKIKYDLTQLKKLSRK